MIKQQGRLLTRVDRLEARLLDGTPTTRSSQGNSSRTPAARPLGFAVGSAVQGFRLPDLAENTVDLEDFRGKRVLLVNWSPRCGFCDLIAPNLAKLLPDLRKRLKWAGGSSYGQLPLGRLAGLDV